MSARSDAWRSRAVTAINAFRARDTGADSAHAYAYMAGACGLMHGWSHAWTTAYLTKVYALANPDGGWGLPQPYDAFQDGSTNPASTTYSVSLAGHVGPVLLTGYKAGVVPAATVARVAALLMAAPRVPVDRGQCVSYSMASADAQVGYNVHNVNAGVARYLQDASAAGVGATGAQALVVDITLHEVAAYNPATRWWSYMADGAPQDADHNSYSAESMYYLAYPVGREAVYQHLTTAYADNALAPIAHMRLVSLPGGPGSWSRTTPGVTLWAELGDQWLPEIDSWIASPPSPAGTRYAQAAYYCARNAVAT